MPSFPRLGRRRSRSRACQNQNSSSRYDKAGGGEGEEGEPRPRGLASLAGAGTHRGPRHHDVESLVSVATDCSEGKRPSFPRLGRRRSRSRHDADPRHGEAGGKPGHRPDDHGSSFVSVGDCSEGGRRPEQATATPEIKKPSSSFPRLGRRRSRSGSRSRSVSRSLSRSLSRGVKAGTSRYPPQDLDLESTVSAGTEGSDDEVSPDDHRFTSSMPALLNRSPTSTAGPPPLDDGAIRRGCRVVTLLRDRDGGTYHRGAPCRARPGVPAWRRHPSVCEGRTCTRFIDESLGIPLPVTEMILHPRKDDVARLFYSKEDIEGFTEELKQSGECYQFAKKMRINGKITTVGIF